MALSCEEIHEQITAYVDDRVDEDEYRQRVAAHIESCSACRDEYEREIMTKMVIRQRFPLVGTPTALRSSIEKGLDAASSASSYSSGGSRASTGSYQSRSRRKSAQGSILFLLLLVAGLGTYILLFKDSGTPTPKVTETYSTPSRAPISAPPRKAVGPVNPFNLAIKNYEDVLAGEFYVEYETTDLAQLKNFFGEKGVAGLAFSGVSLPLKGGQVVTQDGVLFPHLLYGDEKAVLYLFEVSWENLQNGKGVKVTEEVIRQLGNGEQVWVPVSNVASLVMYKNGDAVEVVVSDRPQGEMKRLLGLPA